MNKNIPDLLWLVGTVTCAVLTTKLDYGFNRAVGILLIGVAIGLVLQRSRFCIASAFSDLILFKDGKLFKAVIVLIAVSALGFSLLQANGSKGFVDAFGIRTVIGAILFGIGMTLAGGCAVSTLMRIGEGYVLFAVVFVGLIIGGIIGAYNYEHWSTPSIHTLTVFLPDYFGWTGSVSLLISVLITIWFIVDRRW